MKRVLIIRFSALGDVTIVVPWIRSLVTQYPDTQFTLLSKSFHRDLFADIQAPNFVFYGADLKGRHRGILGLIKLYGDAQLSKMDIVCDLHASQRSLFLSFLLFLSGASIAHIRKERMARRRLVRSKKKVFSPLKSISERYKSVFARMGYSKVFPYVWSPEEKKHCLQAMESRIGPKDVPWIGIAPFAQHQGKIYPLEKMEKVLAHFAARQDCRLFLFGGGRQEMAVFEQWKQDHSCVEIASGKGLQQDIHLIACMDVMLSMDSANMHIASMVGTRVVSVWGATHPYAGFYGIGQAEEHVVSLPLPCRPCSVYGNKACMRGDYACLNDIAPEHIIQKIEEVLAV